jgi:hypothetical protein
MYADQTVGKHEGDVPWSRTEINYQGGLHDVIRWSTDVEDRYDGKAVSKFSVVRLDMKW